VGIHERQERVLTTQDRSAQLLRIPEAARYLQLSRAQTYRLAAQGELPAIRIGRSVRIRQEALDAWLDGKAKQ
jgi:excisionase family DNA binding protein